MDLIIDVVLCGLLVTVIVRSYQIAQKVASVQGMDAQIGPVLKELSQTLAQSSRHIDMMKQTTEKLTAQLSGQIDIAQNLKSDFDFLISHGDKIADKLEALIINSRELTNTPITSEQLPEEKTEETQEAAIVPQLTVYVVEEPDPVPAPVVEAIVLSEPIVAPAPAPSIRPSRAEARKNRDSAIMPLFAEMEPVLASDIKKKRSKAGSFSEAL